MAKGVAFLEARKEFHRILLSNLLQVNASGIASNSDSSNRRSVAVALGIVQRLGEEVGGDRLDGQTAGNVFEEIVKNYLDQTFNKLSHMRPGNWVIRKGLPSPNPNISQFDQYSHLHDLDVLSNENPALRAALGAGYLIKPDVVIYRLPESDSVINSNGALVDGQEAKLTSLRKTNNKLPILHASISCKWTIRSDRAQNARSEALNLVRNRKGRLPHTVVVTGEPLVSRIAAIALGTGDIDCVYHFALPELIDTLNDLDFDDAADLVDAMVRGKRLRDISDLPLDLVI